MLFRSVKIHGIPREARKKHILELIARPMGRFVELDERSLAGSGAVRIRLLCPEPAKIPGSLPPFFFGGEGGERQAILDVELDEDRPRSPSPRATGGGSSGGGSPSEDDSSDDDADDPGAGGARESPSATEALPLTTTAATETTSHSAAPTQASSPVPSPLASPTHFRSAPAMLVPVDRPRTSRPDSLAPLELPLAQYGSNLGLQGLDTAALGLAPSASVEEDCGSVGREVAPPSSSRSAGALCYTLSPGSTPTSPTGSPPQVPTTPATGASESLTVFPDTPVGDSQARPQRRTRQPPSSEPARHSARLALARGGLGMPVPTVEEQAIQLTAARRSVPGMHSPKPSISNSGSRFSVLEEVPLDHLSQVASDCGVVFRGERGPRMDQIAAIKAKEIYEGALAASRAQAELARETAPAAGDPVQAALDPSSNSESLPARVEIPCVTPQTRGNRGRPPKAPSRSSTSGRARSVPRKGTTPTSVSK